MRSKAFRAMRILAVIALASAFWACAEEPPTPIPEIAGPGQEVPLEAALAVELPADAPCGICSWDEFQSEKSKLWDEYEAVKNAAWERRETARAAAWKAFEEAERQARIEFRAADPETYLRWDAIDRGDTADFRDYEALRQLILSSPACATYERTVTEKRSIWSAASDDANDHWRAAETMASSDYHQRLTAITHTWHAYQERNPEANRSIQ